MLEEALSEEQVARLCQDMVSLFRGDQGAAVAAPPAADAGNGANGFHGADDYLVKCENIIMAFAGRVLLKK
eukprot:scaffold403284_cov43-Prasinocladus_malaysianus.AAC.1